MNLIVGAGAVGTILATYLKAAGRPVRLLIRERDRAAYEAAKEIRTDAINGPPVIAPKPEITTKLDLEGIEHLFVCVKFPALDAFLAQFPQRAVAGSAAWTDHDEGGGDRRQ